VFDFSFSLLSLRERRVGEVRASEGMPPAFHERHEQENV